MAADAGEGALVVAITGATSGVGRATARAFAREGASLGLLARGPDALAASEHEARESGVRALALETDVADPQAVDRAAQTIEDELGPIDVWVNNAMATVFAPVHEITADEYRRVTEVTYLGVVYGTISALRRMRPRNRGVIVQVGSALPTAAFRCKAPTAPQSTPSRASTSPCAASCSTSGAGFT